MPSSRRSRRRPTRRYAGCVRQRPQRAELLHLVHQIRDRGRVGDVAGHSPHPFDLWSLQIDGDQLISAAPQALDTDCPHAARRSGNHRDRHRPLQIVASLTPGSEA